MKIGLALGSGAARGWTHIGIIKALEELGIHIDVVAGTSIGAYVGAAYASSKLDALETWACSLTEWQVFSMLGVGFRRGSLASGQRVFDVLKEEFCASRFEELSKPLSVVATDLYSGKEVVFNHGDTIPAIQASCAIPALLPPVYTDNRWLVDGAVVNPVPVNLCQMMGADFVIAVSLTADFRPHMLEQDSHDHQRAQQSTDEFFAKTQNRLGRWLGKQQDNKQQTPGIFGVMSSSLEILQARVTRSRLAGEPPDVLIEPRLRNIGAMEFYRATELVEEGYQSVMRMAEQIRYLLHINKDSDNSPSDSVADK